MIASGSNFRGGVLLLLWLLGALLSGGECRAQGCDSCRVAPERGRRLDRREHVGYEGIERIVPTHLKVQYAGGMGFLSFGAGWDYGRKCRWETDALVGFVPHNYSDKFHATFTLKQNYIPWSIRCSRRLAVEPFTCGIYMNFISGEDYWVREPDRYPTSRYYGFTSRMRLHLCFGQRLTYYLREGNALRHVTLFYELSVSDLDLIAKCGNRTLGLSDIVYFSAGVKFQLIRDR